MEIKLLSFWNNFLEGEENKPLSSQIKIQEIVSDSIQRTIQEFPLTSFPSDICLMEAVFLLHRTTNDAACV